MRLVMQEVFVLPGMPSHIPIEVMETVFDSLTAPTLKSCALVTRNWLPSLRRLLFHTKSLGYSIDFDALAEVLEASPGIADCVRRLKLSGRPRQNTNRLMFFTAHEATASSDWITGMAKVCAKLTHVKFLQLSNFSFQIMEHDDLRLLLRSLIPVMSSAVELGIDNTAFARSEEVQRFLCAFTRITELSLFRTSDSHFTIEITDSPYDVLHMPCLVEGQQGPTLRSLSVMHCSGDIVKPITRSCAFDLQHLTYWTTIGHDTHLLFEAVGKSSEKTLQTLSLAVFGSDAALHSEMGRFPAKMKSLKTFSAYIDTEQLRDPRKFEWVYEAISNLPSSIEHVSLRVSGDIEACKKVDWIRIKGIIGDRDRFGGRIVFVTAQVESDLILAVHPR